MVSLSQAQQAITNALINSRIFLSGPASCGKTTCGIERLRWLLEQGIPGNSILLLTPQRTLQEPYLDLLESPYLQAGGEVTPATVGGLARRMVDLFWPLVGEAAGFAYPDQPPTFLTLETAQYYLALIVRPLLDKGFFDSVTIDHNRLYSQIIDNLNKSSVVGFPHTEIGRRLDDSYYGDPAQRRIYKDAQECANLFRKYCLDHNLLDFSLQLEIFLSILWHEPIVRQHLIGTYQHIIYDNVEEDIPRAHDLLSDWLPSTSSALLIYDSDGGFRRFLGADSNTGLQLQKLCDESLVLDKSFVVSKQIADFSYQLDHAILSDVIWLPTPIHPVTEQAAENSPCEVVSTRFYPQLLDSVADRVLMLIDNEHIEPAEIVILAPYLGDALRFSITNRLQERGIPWHTHRPSRSLNDEPASHVLLTLAKLSNPHWGFHPSRFDLAYALLGAIEGLDLIRAQLLAEIVFRQKDLALFPFDNIKSDIQERITFVLGNRYSVLRNWLLEQRKYPELPLDHFLRKLFGEILSQPGFRFHNDLDSARVAANLVESVRKFRLTLGWDKNLDIGREYITMIQEGVMASQYLEGWQTVQKNAVFIGPAHTFLMTNRPVSFQFWLDPGSSGWYERLSQPLTQPFVLSRAWEQEEKGRVWGDADEVTSSRRSMACLVLGLLRRCRGRLILAMSEVGESGFESRGELLKAFQKVISQGRGSIL